MKQPQNCTQIVRHGFKAFRLEQAVEDFAQGMIAMRRILSHKAKIGGAKGPLLIADIAGVTDGSLARWGWLSGHQQLMPALCSGVQHFLVTKLMTHVLG